MKQSDQELESGTFVELRVPNCKIAYGRIIGLDRKRPLTCYAVRMIRNGTDREHAIYAKHFCIPASVPEKAQPMRFKVPLDQFPPISVNLEKL